jgi:hypothetical protein
MSAALILSPAPAQEPAGTPPPRKSVIDLHEQFMQELELVDQTVEDTSALSTSLRHQHPGLRHPAAFTTVYRVPGRDDLLMRADGGLFAVFPQSVYLNQRGILTAVMPPNTVFHIGRKSLAELGAPDPEDVEALDDEPPPARPAAEVEETPWIGTRVIGVAEAEHQPAGRSTARTIASDPLYRSRRLRELMHAAVAKAADDEPGAASTDR